jgi:hypothetical protein
MSAEGVVLAEDNQVVEELVVAYLVTSGVLVAGTEVDLKVAEAQIAEALLLLVMKLLEALQYSLAPTPTFRVLLTLRYPNR